VRIRRAPIADSGNNLAVDCLALDRVTDMVCSALASGEHIDPLALTLLLCRYRDTDRADLRGTLEPALACALDRAASVEATSDRAAWLRLFADALTLSSDPRLHETTATLAATLRRDWSHTTPLSAAAQSVEACLRACGPLALASMAREAVDELERLVATTYSPGEGLVQRVAGEGQPSISDYLSMSSTLLTAYEMSGRLPYAMLAEELVQSARHSWWHTESGFDDKGTDRRAHFRVNCEAVQVLCRLAALHADEGYRAAAVIRADAAYRADAERLLITLGGRLTEIRADWVEEMAAYGLACIEWLALG
jgi:uncharacterized protein YyaL (SSP411 family)